MIFYQDDAVTLHHGDTLEVLRTLPDESVNCAVTSPPYFGLRDYGNPGQYGLEPSPAAYVDNMRAVFAEVRRVLAKDGTLWLNLGDSYSGGNRSSYDVDNGKTRSRGHSVMRPQAGIPGKNLLGIPWKVAQALQAPQYVGKIRSEADRAWLAGWIDGEGTISYVERDRGPNHTNTHDITVFVTNCDDGPLRHFAAICGGKVHIHDDGTRQNRFGKRVVYRWRAGTHDSALLLRELYPYLRTKKRQAALIWTLFTTLRHNNGHARTPVEVVAKRREIAGMVRTLNAGGDVELPSWVIEPPVADEPGWILRNAICWSKPNAMPESVTDRLSTRHELLFMFSRSRKYWFDLDAIRVEPDHPEVAHINRDRPDRGFTGQADVIRAGHHALGRNPGDVWTIPTTPFPGAHFAVFPPEIPRRAILAGCKPGGTVLDPFSGSGTTGMVAGQLGRKYVGIDLSADYLRLSLETRLAQTALLDGESSAWPA